MSVLVSAYVWKHSQSKGSTRLVLLALADLADDDGIVPPHRSASIEYLTKKCNLDSERTTRYCLRELEGKDLKDGERVVRAGVQPPELAIALGAGRRPSRYQILMRQLPLFAPGGQPEDHDLPAEAAVEKSVDNPVEPVSKGQPVAPLPGKRLPLRGANDVLLRGNRLPPTARSDVTARKGRKAGAVAPPSPPPVDNPVDYEPDAATITWAAQHGFAAYLHLHLGHFRDYIVQPKNRRRYADLHAAFRNSVRADWGDVRMQAQRAARLGQGPDLERWWATPEGVKAKGLSMALPFDPARGPYLAYEIAVLDLAVDRDGWGAWVDKGRRPSEYGLVLRRRKERGADVPEEEESHA